VPGSLVGVERRAPWIGCLPEVNVDDVLPFGVAVAAFSLAGLLAVWSNRFSERIHVPAPALFLLAAALASDVVPSLGRLPMVDVQRVVTLALVLLLFDGGLHIGRARFRTAALPVLVVGVVGTALTAAGIAVFAHLALGVDWRAGLLLGVALSPTDPAVVFSVLGRREVGGRTGTLLEGESGANDPVGIAAMAAVLGAGTLGGWSSVGHGVGEFVLQMAVGGLVGVGGGLLLARVMHRVPLPSGALYPVQTLLGAGVMYGVATAAHGSGFLAVFVAGILLGDVHAPYKGEIERFHSSLASLAEIVAFAVLGLTVSVHDIVTTDRWAVGLLLAVVLAFVLRPLLVGPLLVPVRLRPGERFFVLWSGLKGAVPLLLGTYVLTSGVADAERLYGIIVVVVMFSVVVRAGSVPVVAERTGVPMRVVEPEPWALGMRFRDRPSGLRRFRVAPGAPADGTAIADLELDEDTWISMVSRDGTMLAVRGGTVLRAGDEVLVLVDPDADLEADDQVDPAAVFAPGAG
jgi:cell volume regulation protein A